MVQDNWSQLTTLINTESSRAFPNLYEVTISTDSNLHLSLLNLVTFPYQVKSFNFSDNFGFKLELNESIQIFMMKGVERIKGVTLVFKETSNYAVLTTLKSWINAIYDFNQHVFLPGDPTAVITINLDDNKGNIGNIVIEDAIPQTLTYPNYSWSDSNPIDITATYSCNRVYWKNTADDTLTTPPTPKKTFVYGH